MSNTDRFAPFRLQAIAGLHALIKIPDLWTADGDHNERILLLLEELTPLLVRAPHPFYLLPADIILGRSLRAVP